MKLTKNKLLKTVKSKIENLDYREFKDSVNGSQGLFIKKLPNDLYLSLGLTISRFCEDVFTASFYLSKTTRWSSMWGDIPRKSYERASHFLTMQERELVLINDDEWRNAFDNNHIDKFIQTISLTENRFLSQKSLIQSINNSEVVLRLQYLTKCTMEKAISHKVQKTFNFQPKKNIDDIPCVFFQSAETVLNEENEILNNHTVKILASDAWRQKEINMKTTNSYLK